MLAVVIISWNVRELLHNCLQSLYTDLIQAGVAARVIVVDSASTDGSVDMVKASFPQTELISNETNVGYVRGNNLALKRLSMSDSDLAVNGSGLGQMNALNRLPFASLEYIWFLNPDTLVLPETTQKLLTFMQQHPHCGLCGPKLVNPDGTLQHGAFAFPGIVQLALETHPPLWRFRGTRLDGRYPKSRYESKTPFRIGHPLGAAMLARASAIAQVGALDEGYEMYAEEVDWAMRMSRAGWERWCVPGAVVVHYGGASSAQASERSERIKWRSRLRYYARYYPPIKREIAMKLVPKVYRVVSE